MEIKVITDTSTAKFEVCGNRIKLFADLPRVLQVEKGEKQVISTGITLELPKNVTGALSGEHIEEDFVPSGRTRITVVFSPSACKSIKPNELLGDIEFIPNFNFKLERGY